MSISGFLPEELFNNLALEKSYRALQLFKWIQSGSNSFDDMTDLPQALREQLKSSGKVHSSTVSETIRDQHGNTKLRILLQDSHRIECISLFDENERHTACLSTQVGCGMGCGFCKTGTMGLRRNLVVHEILEQFFHIRNKCGLINNVVFMGMGEPLANLENVLKAIELLHHPSGNSLSLRKMTVSTCGLPSGIRRLAETVPQVKLSVSLIAADQNIRSRLMPIARKVPLNELKDALAYHQMITGKRTTIDIVLLAGINDNAEQAGRIVEFSRDFRVLVNIIPWNPIPEIKLAPPLERSVVLFKHQLEKKGLSVSVRFERGSTIRGACGQLGG